MRAYSSHKSAKSTPLRSGIQNSLFSLSATALSKTHYNTIFLVDVSIYFNNKTNFSSKYSINFDKKLHNSRNDTTPPRSIINGEIYVTTPPHSMINGEIYVTTPSHSIINGEIYVTMPPHSMINGEIYVTMSPHSIVSRLLCNTIVIL
jgi:hypothetical protein